MLRAFGIKPSRLMRRTSHQEFARRYRHHVLALRTFLESAVGLILWLILWDSLRPQQEMGRQNAGQKGGGANCHGSIKAGTSPGATRFVLREGQGKVRIDDPQAQIRPIPALFPQEKPQNWEAAQSGDFQQPGGGGKT
jgi:hypothetical protein